MIHTTEQLGPNQALTPEGFLLCAGVPIARTGTLIYAAGEIPADPNAEGVIYVKRLPEEVFAPEAIASFEGKPVTNLHPDAMVSPDNWQEVAVGTVQNVRQEDNLLVADLLITQAQAIKDVQDGLREVSCGYEAGYEQTEPGYATQKGIVGNHVALVPNGRCGPTCAIKDTAMTKKSIKDRLMAAFKTRDEATIKATLDEMPEEGGDLHIHVGEQHVDEDPVETRFKKIEDAIEALTPKVKDAEPDDDDDEDEGESATGDSAQKIISKAAILAPGLALKAPTGDAKSKAVKDALCGCKLRALQTAYATDAGKSAIDTFLAGRALDSLKGPALDAVFNGAAALMGALNNANVPTRTVKDFGPAPKSVADINQANRDFWAKRTNH